MLLARPTNCCTAAQWRPAIRRSRCSMACPPAAAAMRTEHAAARATAAAAGVAGTWAIAALLMLTPPACAADAPAIFERSCAGCHSGGGNIIRRDATLQQRDLEKYGYADQDSMVAIIANGRNSMPGFGASCAPRGACTFGPRLADDDIAALAAFVLSSAKDGWQQ